MFHNPSLLENFKCLLPLLPDFQHFRPDARLSAGAFREDFAADQALHVRGGLVENCLLVLALAARDLQELAFRFLRLHDCHDIMDFELHYETKFIATIV